MFQFSGTLTQEALSGRLSRASRIGAPGTEQEDVILRRAEATKYQRSYATFEEWRQMAEEFLERRGPKIVKEQVFHRIEPASGLRVE